jgi:hypothetical protein
MSGPMVVVEHIQPEAMRFPLLEDDLFHELERFFPIAFSFVSNDDAPAFNAVMSTLSPCEEKKPDHAARSSRFDDEMSQLWIGTRFSMLLSLPRDDKGPILRVLLQSKDRIQVALGCPTELDAA